MPFGFLKYLCLLKLLSELSNPNFQRRDKGYYVPFAKLKKVFVYNAQAIVVQFHFTLNVLEEPITIWNLILRIKVKKLHVPDIDHFPYLKIYKRVRNIK